MRIFKLSDKVVLGAVAFIVVRTTALILVMSIISVNCYSVERTEAQRYYDLGVSYIKSDLYEKGLETLNQVAFLYPDSDVADDALYQLAMIREQVGDGEIFIGEKRKLEAEMEVATNLYNSPAPDGVVKSIMRGVLTSILAQMAGEIVFEPSKEQAIVQYLLALDYLNTLLQRYSDSDRLEDSGHAFERIVGKINRLTQPTPPKPTRSTKEEIFIFIGVSVGMIVIALLLSSS